MPKKRQEEGAEVGEMEKKKNSKNAPGRQNTSGEGEQSWPGML